MRPITTPVGESLTHIHSLLSQVTLWARPLATLARGYDSALWMCPGPHSALKSRLGRCRFRRVPVRAEALAELPLYVRFGLVQPVQRHLDAVIG